VKPLSTLIKKIEQSLRKNKRNVPLLDMVLMILVINYFIMKSNKSVEVDMLYLMKGSFIRIKCRKRNKKNKTKNTQSLM